MEQGVELCLPPSGIKNTGPGAHGDELAIIPIFAMCVVCVCVSGG